MIQGIILKNNTIKEQISIKGVACSENRNIIFQKNSIITKIKAKYNIN